ncbi:MAG: hypothetical protein VB140_03285 [Burkholderia sp.]
MRTSLVRNPFISPEIIDPKFVINMPVDAIASSRLIYATTPFQDNELLINMQQRRLNYQYARR